METDSNLPVDFVNEFMIELSKIGRKTRNIFDSGVRERDLTLARARALHLLSSHSSMNQTELAAALEIEHPSVVRLLDGMERQGLVTRKPMQGDRRVRRIELTSLAKAQLQELEALTTAIGVRLLRNIDPGDLEIALAVLQRIGKNIENELVSAGTRWEDSDDQ